MSQQATIARIVKSHTRYSAPESNQIAERILFLLRHPDVNPLRTERLEKR